MQAAYAYSTSANEWVGYENLESMNTRCNYINNENFAGMMVWDTSLDDMTGEYCNEGAYPLISHFKNCLNWILWVPILK